MLTLEIVPELVTMARENLRKAGIQNAEVRLGDGAQPVPAQGRYDAILLSGSVAEVPHNLLALLNIGARLAAIVGEEPVMRATVITRVNQAEFTTTQNWDTVAPRLLNFPEPSRFKF